MKVSSDFKYGGVFFDYFGLDSSFDNFLFSGMFIEDFSVILGIYMLIIIDLSGMFYDSLELAIIYSELKYLKNKDSVKVVFFVDFKIGRIFDFDFFRAIFRDFKFSFFLNINRFSIYIVNL